ncbi:SWIM zinc finger domain-containing protein [Hellea sp.]|nr:SWIM zinc finger domain-containing protein [Hellea sp.]
MTSGIDFTYKYAFPSGLMPANDHGRPYLSLATCDSNHEKPYFFDGKMRHPRIFGDMLVTLSDVVRTHYFLPSPGELDPVLTSNESLLRLEGFSGCCGVYARVDLPAESFDGNCHGRGTTNVDFNTPMRNALMRLRENDDVSFSVGQDEVALTKGELKSVEKKVKLPLRWIKGFSEVQAYQPRLELAMEVSASDALRFIRSLPKSAKPKMPSYVVSAGRALRLSQRPAKGAVQILGTHRVKTIEPLLPRAKTLKIWHDPNNGTSAWEVCYVVGSFFLMISPEVYRGFSGEGQALSQLSTPPDDKLIAQVRAQLKWQSEINANEIAKTLNLPVETVNGALAVLGTRGLAGFDINKAQYFHRELPFDMSKVEAMQPRLKNARKLIEKGLVDKISTAEQMPIYAISGTGIIHRVELRDKGDHCTCPWFSRYQGKRGPCKHILAANIVEHTESSE